MRILIKREAGLYGEVTSGGQSSLNYGFTLTEMIVTLAVMTVVLGAATAGVMGWQRHSIYNRNNEYAQALFVAAQTALAYEEAAGRLAEIGVYVGNGGAGSGIAREHDGERRLYYLDITMGEYESLETNGNRLYRLLRNYVYDRGIFHAAIRLEFDPEDGMVYALSYTDRADHFEYSNAEGKDGSAMGIYAGLREDEQKRKDRMMGYQDSGMPSEIPPVTDGKPTVSDVKIHQGETLELHFSPAPDFRLFWEKYSYHIELYDDTDKMKAAFSIGIDELRETDGDPGTSHKETLTMTLYDGWGNAVVTRAATEVTVTEEGEIRILLDGVDMQAARILDELLRLNITGKNPLDAKEYLDTYSLTRFCEYEEDGAVYGLNTHTRLIYAKVSASVEGHSGKQSMSNKTGLFVGLVREEKGKKSFQIQNARHLFNIRILEVYYRKSAEQAALYYEQSTDIRWGGADGMIDHRRLYDSSRAGTGSGSTGAIDPAGIYEDGKGKRLGTNEEYAPFPAIPFLGRDSSYTAAAEAGKNYSIVNLTLQEEIEADIGDPVTLRNRALGLFRVNEGIVEQAGFLDIRVNGKNFVGAVCGLNEGVLRRIEIRRSEEEKQKASGGRGYINGFDYVGGIAGGDWIACEKDEDRARLTESYLDLINESDIYGRSYVGGIIGASRIGNSEDERELGIVRCTNKGRLETTIDYPKNGTTFNQFHYFGGITGYKSGGCISDCAASVGELTAATVKLPSFLDKEDYPCDYMGGIVGYCDGNTDITRCRTEGGVLQGRYYIGGIVGLWDGEGLLDGGGAYNKVTVMGVKYVGGITGASARSADGRVFSERAPEIEVRNWENQGIALSMDGCSGGVSGYNTGTIIDCGSRTELPEPDLSKVLKLGRQWRSVVHANSWGGVAGYNNGMITGTMVHNVYSIVSGEDCVGGIVGYNDTDAEFDSRYYRLEGGYLQGSGFVGGAVGYNTSPALFGNSEAEAREKPMWAGPDRISGKCFVGGIIGGNMVSADENEKLYLACGTDNPSGIVTGLIEDNYAGGIYIGGYIGYNRLIGIGAGGEALWKEMDRLASGARTRWYGDQARRSVETIIKAVNGGSPLTSAGIEEPAAAMYILDAKNNDETGSIQGVPGSKATEGGKTVFDSIGAAGESTEEGESGNRLGEVSGGLYIGGIIGYNDVESRLFLLENVNHAKVYSTDWIEGIERTCLKKNEDGAYIPAQIRYMDNVWKSDGEIVFYSYTGGVISLIGEGVTLENCRTAGEVSQSSIVTYRGTLAEINEGVISGCVAEDSGSADSVYAGGLVGRNSSSGRIWNCTLQGTVSARAAGGGFAAENYGVIGSTDGGAGACRISGRVCVSETAAGGAAAFNAGTIRGCILSGSVEGTAAYTGGMAGISLGSVERCETEGAPKVRGSGFVGGFIGYMRNPASGVRMTFGNPEKTVVCTALVTADGAGGEAAGGMIGYLDWEEGDGSVELINCEMTGTVTSGAVSNGAGGVVGGCKGAGAENLRLLNCTNRGTVEGYGSVGGIAGYVEAFGGCVQINGCRNYGRIISKDANRYAAGILSAAKGDEAVGSGSCIRITDCINTGNVDGYRGAGIYGIHEAAAGAEILNCRNYGYGAEGASDRVSGILGGAEKSSVLIRDCYGVSRLRSPVSLVDQGRLSPGSGNNFYFVPYAEVMDKTVKMQAAFTPYNTVSPAEYAVDYSPETRFSVRDRENGKTMGLSVTFRNPDGTEAAIQTSGIQIAWYKPHRYHFKLYVRYEGADTYTQLYDESGGEEWSMTGPGVTIVNGKEVCEVSLPAKDNAQVTADFTKSPGFTSEKAVSGIRIEYLTSENETDGQAGEFSIWDIHVNGLEEPQRTFEGVAEEEIGKPLAVLPAENGKWKAVAPLSGQAWIPLLDQNPCGGSGEEEALFRAIDGQLSNGGNSVTRLQAPEPVSVTAVNSKLCRLSWAAVEGAYFYRVKMELYDDEAGNIRNEVLGGSVTVPYGTACDIPAESVWADKYMKASVQAVSIFNERNIEAEFDSGWASSSLERWEKERLPTTEITVREKEEQVETDGITSISSYEVMWNSEQGVGGYDVNITDLNGREHLLTIELPETEDGVCEVTWDGRKVTGEQATDSKTDFIPGEGEDGDEAYGFELPSEESSELMTRRYSRRLTLETDKIGTGKLGYAFKLVLPDIGQLYRVDSDIRYSYLFTSSVTVQARAIENSPFAESGVRAWARVLGQSGQGEEPENWLVEGEKGEKIQIMIERADGSGAYRLYIQEEEGVLPKERKSREDTEEMDRLPKESEVQEESESELPLDGAASDDTEETAGESEAEETSGGNEMEEPSDSTQAGPPSDGNEPAEPEEPSVGTKPEKPSVGEEPEEPSSGTKPEEPSVGEEPGEPSSGEEPEEPSGEIKLGESPGGEKPEEAHSGIKP